MKIGVIGVGRIGGTLAKQYREAGHAVLIANSRGPDTLTDLAEQINVTAVNLGNATKDVDLIVVSIPFMRIGDLPKDLFNGVAHSVPVIDTSNYYPGVRGNPTIEEIEGGMPESEWVGKQLGRSVVKAYSSILAPSLSAKGRPKGTLDRLAVPVAGDDPDARAIVLGLLDETGFDGVDAGPLSESWRFQPGTPAYCTDLDANDTRRALAMAERNAAPAHRDEILRVYAETGATADDMVKITRSIAGTEVTPSDQR
jgi:8-hydroxy-5-deazaflavin:NADPH oxidoreductase